MWLFISKKNELGVLVHGLLRSSSQYGVIRVLPRLGHSECCSANIVALQTKEHRHRTIQGQQASINGVHRAARLLKLPKGGRNATYIASGGTRVTIQKLSLLPSFRETNSTFSTKTCGCAPARLASKALDVHTTCSFPMCVSRLTTDSYYFSRKKGELVITKRDEIAVSKRLLTYPIAF